MIKSKTNLCCTNYGTINYYSCIYIMLISHIITIKKGNNFPMIISSNFHHYVLIMSFVICCLFDCVGKIGNAYM